MKNSLISIIGFVIVLLTMGILTIMFEHWEIVQDIFPLPVSKPRRVVVSLSTFSTRLQVTALDCIADLLAHQTMDRLLVTVSLNHRKEQGSCLYAGECVGDEGIEEASTVTDVLHLFRRRFGMLRPVGKHSFELGKVYLQIMTAADFGPATKLLGALMVEQDPDTILVTVDDDSYYFRGFVQNLASRLPHNSVLGVMFQRLNPRGEPEIINTPLLMRIFYEGYGQPIHHWLMGVSGIAYRVGYFDSHIFEEARQLPRECFLNDDVWLGGYLKRKGIHPFVYFGWSLYKHVRHATKSLSSIRGAQSTDITACARRYRVH